MKYQPTINIWDVPSADRSSLQRGQWVKAGKDGPKGVWIGQKENGIDVVMWHETRSPSKLQALINYVRGKR